MYKKGKHFCEFKFIKIIRLINLIVNLLNDSDNKNSKFVTKKWYVIDSESKGNYSHENPIKFLASSLESNLCDYSDAYILVTGNITATPNNAATQLVFKNCAPFKDFRTEINDTFVDCADFINIAMPMYNLIEYSDNYSDTSGSLWDFKYKASLIGNTENNGTKNGNKITDAKLYIPIVILSAEDNAKLSKLLGEGFKTPVYWNKYKVIDNKVVQKLLLILKKNT